MHNTAQCNGACWLLHSMLQALSLCVCRLQLMSRVALTGVTLQTPALGPAAAVAAQVLTFCLRTLSSAPRLWV